MENLEQCLDFADEGRDCHDYYDCCDCGISDGDGCGCAYCWSCQACENCLNKEE